MSTRPRFLGILLAASLVCPGGCGKKNEHATITGTVKFDGAPLDKGLIEFRTANGAGVLALARITDGAFTVDKNAKLPHGTYKILISATRKTGKKIYPGSPAPPGILVDELVERLPSQYNEESKLEKTVNAGENLLEFDLHK